MEMAAVCPFTIPASWQTPLAEELAKPYMIELAAFVEKERRFQPPIYPPKELAFNALQQTPFEAVRVVVVGQDPYHGPGQAHGLSFSVPEGVPIPPSLRNIYKELQDDLGIPPAKHGSLLFWAEQGVLLLNATLTVRKGEPKSHYGKGWERFTDAAIREVAKREKPVVFLLWGRSAKDKVEHAIKHTSCKEHCILTAAHPSPLSAHNGFFGCRHFSKANAFLEKHGAAAINWSVE